MVALDDEKAARFGAEKIEVTFQGEVIVHKGQSVGCTTAFTEEQIEAMRKAWVQARAAEAKAEAYAKALREAHCPSWANRHERRRAQSIARQQARAKKKAKK